MLSTRLSWPAFSSNSKTQATNYCLICYVFIIKSQRPDDYLRNFRTAISYQPRSRAWSDVSSRRLASGKSDPTILQIKQRELHCSCQLNCLDPVNERSPFSTCLHTYSTCCQNQLSPKSAAKLHKNLHISKYFCTFAAFFDKFHKNGCRNSRN